MTTGDILVSNDQEEFIWDISRSSVRSRGAKAEEASGLRLWLVRYMYVCRWEGNGSPASPRRLALYWQRRTI